ncbi:hypothetical protein O0L34_g9841 [Tuta absoluta]|nr:hypothetical protein O0L34_g9841 [Tuta absoluta]
MGLAEFVTESKELDVGLRKENTQEEEKIENNQDNTCAPEEFFIVDYGENPHERSESPLEELQVSNSPPNPVEERQQESGSLIGAPKMREVESLVFLEKAQTSIKKNKAARVLGKAYVGYKKIGDKYKQCIEKPAKIMKARCLHTNTEFKTSQTFLCAIVSEEERIKLHLDFWNLKTWDEKKAYIKALAVRREIDVVVLNHEHQVQ